MEVNLIEPLRRLQVNRRVMRFKASGPFNDPVHPVRQQKNGNNRREPRGQIPIFDQSKKPRLPALERIDGAVREKHQTATMSARLPIRVAR
jgi:hypothetical protein